MSDVAFCPGCGNEVRPLVRYRSYFCRGCHDQAIDGEGRSLKFANQSIGGGFTWSDDGGETWNNDHLYVICYIKGDPTLVGEHRFGGCVSQPLTSIEFDIPYEHIVDLRSSD